MPRDERPAEQKKETAEDITARPEIHVISVETQHYDDLASEYFSQVESNYAEATADSSSAEGNQPANAAPAEDFNADSYGADSYGGEDAQSGGGSGPSGEGWVVQLSGYHYHNGDKTNEAGRFVKRTLIENLEKGSVMLPEGEGDNPIPVSFADLGISHPWLAVDTQLTDEIIFPDGEGGAAGRAGRGYGEGGRGVAARRSEAEEGEDAPKPIELKRYNFVVQFCWQPTTPSERVVIRENRAKEEAAAREQAQATEDQTESE